MSTSFSNPQTKSLCAMILFSALAILPGTTLADKDKWRANNHSDQKVKVVFLAAGCAGVKPTCTKGNFSTVCKAKTLHPGQSTEYKFKGGTSGRKKIVCNMEITDEQSASESQKESGRRWSSDRKENGIYAYDGWKIKWDKD